MNWRADLDTTRRLLLTSFDSNPLASRSLEVLDRLLPDAAPRLDEFSTTYFEPSVMDFSMWPVDADDPLNAFGWPEFHQGQ